MQQFEPPDCLIEYREAICAGESVGRKRAKAQIVTEHIFNSLSGFGDGGAPAVTLFIGLIAPSQEMDKQDFQPGPDFPPLASAHAFDFLREVVVVELVDSPAAQGVGL